MDKPQNIGNTLYIPDIFSNIFSLILVFKRYSNSVLYVVIALIFGTIRFNSHRLHIFNGSCDGIHKESNVRKGSCATSTTVF